MKRIKKALLALLAGFLVFAPPGTMIFLFVLAVGIFRNHPLILCGILIAAAALALLLIRRRRSTRRAEVSDSKL